jgi:translation elongation factor EF-Ts
VIERMVQGRMSKFFEEATLLGQAHMVEEGNPKVRRTLEALAMMQKYSHPFTNPIWYPDKPPQVSKYMASLSKKLGVTVTVSAFQRFAVGEGGNNE